MPQLEKTEVVVSMLSESPESAQDKKKEIPAYSQNQPIETTTSSSLKKLKVKMKEIFTEKSKEKGEAAPLSSSYSSEEIKRDDKAASPSGTNPVTSLPPSHKTAKEESSVVKITPVFGPKLSEGTVIGRSLPPLPKGPIFGPTFSMLAELSTLKNTWKTIYHGVRHSSDQPNDPFIQQVLEQNTELLKENEFLKKKLEGDNPSLLSDIKGNNTSKEDT